MASRELFRSPLKSFQFYFNRIFQTRPKIYLLFYPKKLTGLMEEEAKALFIRKWNKNVANAHGNTVIDLSQKFIYHCGWGESEKHRKGADKACWGKVEALKFCGLGIFAIACVKFCEWSSQTMCTYENNLNPFRYSHKHILQNPPKLFARRPSTTSIPFVRLSQSICRRKNDENGRNLVFTFLPGQK